MSSAKPFVIAVGLSMDMFTISICKDLVVSKVNWKGTLLVELYFDGFQIAMPLFEYFLGFSFSLAVCTYDRWVAFILLAVVGASMIEESFSKDEECLSPDLDTRSMVFLAITISIDALAMGVALAFLSVDILPTVSFIESVTLFLSVVGVKTGNAFGCRYKSKAKLAGGTILILIGFETLLEHLGTLFE